MYTFNVPFLPIGYRQLHIGETVRSGDLIAYRSSYYGQFTWTRVNAAYHKVGLDGRLIYCRMEERKIRNV